LGIVLVQDDKKKKKKVIVYETRRLRVLKRKYPTIEKECLAVI